MKIAVVRGKYLNRYEMQYYEPLAKKHQLIGFASLKPFHDQFTFPVVKLPSPMDLPNFPFKMPILNRLFIDAQYLYGLETNLKGFDLVHTAETYLNFTHQALCAKKKGDVKKVVATVSENIPFANEGIWGRKRFKRQAIRELDHLIAISERAKEALILEGADPQKITVINHHLDTNAFRPAPKRKPGQKINILFVGRLDLSKGVYEFIFAAKRLLTDPQLKNYQLNFTLVGQGKEKRKLVKLARRMKIGKQLVFKSLTYDKMPNEYQKATIFTAPSRAIRHWQEQFSMALLEAQASGLPIVTTRSGAIEENVGEAALLVQPADFYSLAKAIKRLILNPELRAALAEKARKRAVEKFDIQLGAQKLLVVYEKVLAQ